MHEKIADRNEPSIAKYRYENSFFSYDIKDSP